MFMFINPIPCYVNIYITKEEEEEESSEVGIINSSQNALLVEINQTLLLNKRKGEIGKLCIYTFQFDKGFFSSLYP